MKTLSLALAVGLLALLASGCGGNRDKALVGKWTGKITMPEGQKNDVGAKFAEALMNNVSLELKEDKKFTLTMMFPIEGTWSTSGDALNLKVEKFMGMTVDQVKDMSKGQPNADKVGEFEKPMEFTISGDNKTLTAKKGGSLAAGQGQGDLVFTKS